MNELRLVCFILAVFANISVFGQISGFEYEVSAKRYNGNVSVKYFLDTNGDKKPDKNLPKIIDINEYPNAHIIVRFSNLIFEKQKHKRQCLLSINTSGIGRSPRIKPIGNLNFKLNSSADSENYRDIIYKVDFSNVEQIGKIRIIYKIVPSKSTQLATVGGGGNTSPKKYTISAKSNTVAQKKDPIKKVDYDKEAWEKVKYTNTPYVIRTYLIQYPNSQYAAQARTKLNQMDRSAWNSAKQKNNMLGYSEYLNNFENGIYTRQARESKTILENAKRQETRTSQNENTKPNEIDTEALTISDAWEVAQRKNTLEEYESFMDKYPASQYYKLASNKVKEIKSITNIKSETTKTEPEKPKSKKETTENKVVSNEIIGNLFTIKDFEDDGENIYFKIEGGKPPFVMQFIRPGQGFISHTQKLKTEKGKFVLKRSALPKNMERDYNVRVGDQSKSEWLELPQITLVSTDGDILSNPIMLLIIAIPLTIIITIASYRIYAYSRRKEEDPEDYAGPYFEEEE